MRRREQKPTAPTVVKRPSSAAFVPLSVDFCCERRAGRSVEGMTFHTDFVEKMDTTCVHRIRKVKYVKYIPYHAQHVGKSRARPGGTDPTHGMKIDSCEENNIVG